MTPEAESCPWCADGRGSGFLLSPLVSLNEPETGYLGRGGTVGTRGGEEWWESGIPNIRVVGQPHPS